MTLNKDGANKLASNKLAANMLAQNKLALIAGRGDLPLKIIQKNSTNRSIVVIAFDGQTDVDLRSKIPADIPILITKLGIIQPILDFLKEHQVTEIVMAGGITRPKFRDLAVDRTGAHWLTMLGSALLKGDDHLLKGILHLLEKEGYSIVSADDLLNDLFITKGNQTHRVPTAGDQFDIDQGIAILNALSPFDVGQSIVIQDGCVLGIETISGTKVMLQQVAMLDRVEDQQRKNDQRAGVLIKKQKINQSRKVDLPTIGPDTIEQVKQAGLAGLALEAGAVQVLDLEHVIAMANEAGLFLVGF